MKIRDIYMYFFGFYIWPHWDMTTGILGRLLGPVGTFSTFLMTRRPSIMRPKTTCFRSRKSHLAQVTKNWQPFVSLPANRKMSDRIELKFQSKSNASYRESAFQTNL